ncbi:hypothetical protein T484DRAFT_1771549, partial [Baffinella frigidus]
MVPESQRREHEAAMAAIAASHGGDGERAESSGAAHQAAARRPVNGNQVVPAKVWSMFMMGTIVLSSVSFVVQTIPYYYYDEANVFQTLETLCVIFFTIEYTLRFVCSPLPGEGPEREQSDVSEQIDGAPRSKPAATAFVIVQSRIKFMMGYMNIIDLLAIFPFYLEVVLTASNNGVPPAETTGIAFVRVGSLIDGVGSLIDDADPSSHLSTWIAFVRVIRITRVFRLLKLGKHNDGMQILLLTLEESSTFLTSVLFLVLIIQ